MLGCAIVETNHGFVKRPAAGRLSGSEPTGSVRRAAPYGGGRLQAEGVVMHETYEAPAVTELGSVEDMTRATHQGVVLDNAFPAGTPLTQLTTS